MEKRDRASQVVWEIVTKQTGEISKRDWYFTRQIVAVKEEKLKHNNITELRRYLSGKLVETEVQCYLQIGQTSQLSRNTTIEQITAHL